MDPATILGIGSILTPLLGKLFGGGDDNDAPYSKELEQLLGLQRQRMQQSQPLHDAILKMAMGLMPTSAQPQMGGSAVGQSGGAHYAVPRQSAPMRY
jgi:hypothetical protein